MVIKTVLEGDAELARRLAAMIDGLGALNDGPAGTEAAALVAERAEAQAPFRSGALQDTIRTFANKSNAGIRVGFARVPYAGPVVGGHGSASTPRAQGGYMRPNPFPFDALDQRYTAVIDTYDRFIQKLVDGEPVRTGHKYKNHESS